MVPIAAAVESTQDVLVAFKLSDGMYMQALIKELKLQPELKAVDDVKDNVEDEELVEGQQSSVNGAREEKEDEEVEPIEIKDEVQQKEEANDDEKDAESDGNATDDGYGEFGARGVHKRLRKWTPSDFKSCPL